MAGSSAVAPVRDLGNYANQKLPSNNLGKPSDKTDRNRRISVWPKKPQRSLRTKSRRFWRRWAIARVASVASLVISSGKTFGVFKEPLSNICWQQNSPLRQELWSGLSTKKVCCSRFCSTPTVFP